METKNRIRPESTTAGTQQEKRKALAQEKEVFCRMIRHRGTSFGYFYNDCYIVIIRYRTGKVEIRQSRREHHGGLGDTLFFFLSHLIDETDQMIKYSHIDTPLFGVSEYKNTIEDQSSAL